MKTESDCGGILSWWECYFMPIVTEKLRPRVKSIGKIVIILMMMMMISAGESIVMMIVMMWEQPVLELDLSERSLERSEFLTSFHLQFCHNTGIT